MDMNTIITKQQLENLYVSQRLTYKEIAEKLDSSIAYVRKAMKQHGITPRPKGAMQGKACKPEIATKIAAAHKGKKFSEEHRLNISKSKKGPLNPRWGKPFFHPKRYWVTCPNEKVVSMRSRWEVAYATWLGDRKWDYEPKTFILEDGSAYTPDFYLQEEDTYVEVKGWFTETHKIKIDLFKKNYPDIKFILANKDYLESLGIDLKQDWISTRPKFNCKLCNKEFYRIYKEQFLCSVLCRNRYVTLNRSN